MKYKTNKKKKMMSKNKNLYLYKKTQNIQILVLKKLYFVMMKDKK